MKRALSLILTIALFVTLLPSFAATQTASAAGSYFLFPNENDTRANARIVSTGTIQLEGTINGVVGSSISYNVKQVTSSGTEEVLNTTEEITTGVATTGDNRISVSSLILFPGMNKITFKGVAGASSVTESIYIEYRDSPMLYDLKVQFENQEYDLLEDQPTMLYSTAPIVSSTGQVVITGRAPNATKVTIDINGRSFDFNVSTASSNNRFSTSQLTIDKGINNISFRVHNGGQVVQTTRQVAFYNGEVTYYDLAISQADGSNKVALQQNLNYGTATNAGLKISGKAIIPLPLHDLTGNANDTIDHDDPAFLSELTALLTMQVQGGSTVTPVANSVSYLPTTITDATKFITVSFTYTLPTVSYDVSQSIRFKSPNLNQYNESTWTAFTLRDNSKAYVYDVNYLTGFDSSMTKGITGNNIRSEAINTTRILNLQSTDIPTSGVDVYSVPMGVELLIGNYEKLLNTPTPATPAYAEVVDSIVASVSGSSAFTYKMVMAPNGGAAPNAPLAQVVTRQVNNQTQSFLRVFLEIQKLPKSGTNLVSFKFNTDFTTAGKATTEVKTVTARLLYGPYMKFNTIVNGMDVKFDSVKGTNASLMTQLGNFEGQLFNVVNDAEIDYTAPGQSVFLYINNVEVPLVPDASTTTKFKPAPSANADFIGGILNKAGENTVKFVFISASNNYESTLKFNIVPTNLPVVPALDSDGVYPYSRGQWPPLPNDPNFTKQGSVYTTKDAYYDVYGTFDFIDLGGQNDVVTNLANVGNKNNYIVNISSPNWSTDVTWDLSKQFKLSTNNRTILKDPSNTAADYIMNSGSSGPTGRAGVTFYYDVDKENFFFNIANEVMPEDGSSMVYVVTVYNAGPNGPRATYRLEINPISIPYNIKAPLTEERITNKNFVEVIISSPGADSITIGKEKAEKVTFKEYSGSTVTNVDAFRAVVKDLRAGRDTKIPFQITRGEDTIKQELTVKYVPTNIPGAQMLETMASSHKLFNNSLTLTFTKNTQLIRPNYNNSNGHATQVYNGNDLLFAIANPNDGIVDRHLYEGQPPNYSANSQAEGNLHIGYRFQDQARQFIKASPLYWIDGGLADDPDPILSPGYDPITTGQDPFPFPNLVGKYEGNFASRWNRFDLELVPSAPGSLTITYDSNVVQSAGTTITVFRFDPYNSTWENIGGVVDEKKRTVTVPFNKFGYYVAVKLTKGFNDITDHPYAREAMEAIFSKGIMNAVDPVGLFGGDRYVTRGEFTRMIVRAMNLPLNFAGDHHFSYYPETITNANNASAIYDYRYIETAARAGIVNGKRPGFFDEDVELSRQEAATILARALQLKLETDSTKAKSALDKVFKDSGTFDFYSIPSVLAIQKKAFIQGKLINPLEPKDGSVFEPRARLLRSDAAIIMARVMNDMKKLPKIYN
ncbi:S-layer homology domain-containing protein [Paenibacillus sp. PAMC21692]|uniref:S-layer homology domain-containing protein n=1 Tax=Paenibacillus sp. PAMC21692 TaxID=2762320 RepID=UPI00164E1693|nr:S-layer homology domain-containing protein [Paenibacillus sp. PAMC21692]QNK58340.1 S-layer homology domain-containing protein [Paenibacillus sp. PAMC21692]